MFWSLISYSNIMWIECDEVIMSRRVLQECHVHTYSDRQSISRTILQNAISERYARNVQLEKEKVVHSLLCYDADVNESCSELDTALHMTCHKEKDSIVKILVDHEADVKLQEEEFETALIATAVDLSNIQSCSLTSILYDNIIALLLRQKTDVNVCSSKYETTLNIANHTSVKDYYTRALLKKHDIIATLWYLFTMFWKMYVETAISRTRCYKAVNDDFHNLPDCVTKKLFSFYACQYWWSINSLLIKRIV